MPFDYHAIVFRRAAAPFFAVLFFAAAACGARWRERSAMPRRLSAADAAAQRAAMPLLTRSLRYASDAATRLRRDAMPMRGASSLLPFDAMFFAICCLLFRHAMLMVLRVVVMSAHAHAR